MNKTRAAALAVVLILVAGAGFLALRSWVGLEAGQDLAGNDTATSSPSVSVPATPSAEPTPSPTPTSSPTPTPSPTASPSAQLVSPAGIAADIQARLDRTGPRTSLTCPQAVSEAVGTSFTCSVAYADRPGEVVADASVDIVGPGLRYVWRSNPR